MRSAQDGEVLPGYGVQESEGRGKKRCETLWQGVKTIVEVSEEEAAKVLRRHGVKRGAEL